MTRMRQVRATPRHDCRERSLVNALRARSVEALGAAFDRYHGPLLRIVNLRMDHRLRRRVDEDDVLQESYLHAARRLDHFADVWTGSSWCFRCSTCSGRVSDTVATSDCDSTIFLWLRLIVRQTLVDLYRFHLATGKRDLHREVASDRVRVVIGQNADLVGHASRDIEQPSEPAIRKELSAVLRAAAHCLSERDQRVIALRHEQGMSNSQVAAVLDLSEKAASICYARAVKRLRQRLSEV